jgi:exosortase A
MAVSEAQKREGLKVGLLGLLVVILYAPTFPMFIYDWSTDDNYSHGFLVPVIVGYLIWMKREELGRLVPRPSWLGLVVLVAGLGVYLVGTIGAEWFLRRVSLIVVLGGVILAVYGVAYLRVLLFPLGFLFFMVPLPAIVYTGIAFRLQLVVSRVSAVLISLAGVSVFQRGNILEVSTGPLAVEEACSGMRSIMALLALSALFAYLRYRTPLKQWILVVCALPVAVVTNILRVTVTGILAHHFGREMAEGVLHDSFGWIVFVVAFVLLFGVSVVLDWVVPSRGDG